MEKLETFGKLPMPKRIRLTEAGAYEEPMPEEGWVALVLRAVTEKEVLLGEDDVQGGRILWSGRIEECAAGYVRPQHNGKEWKENSASSWRMQPSTRAALCALRGGGQ